MKFKMLKKYKDAYNSYKDLNPYMISNHQKNYKGLVKKIRRNYNLSSRHALYMMIVLVIMYLISIFIYASNGPAFIFNAYELNCLAKFIIIFTFIIMIFVEIYIYPFLFCLDEINMLNNKAKDEKHSHFKIKIIKNIPIFISVISLFADMFMPYNYSIVADSIFILCIILSYMLIFESNKMSTMKINANISKIIHVSNINKGLLQQSCSNISTHFSSVDSCISSMSSNINKTSFNVTLLNKEITSTINSYSNSCSNCDGSINNNKSYGN